MAYNKKEYRRKRIKNRIRKIVSGTPVRPRMSVFRSNRDIYVQVIDDEAGVTLVSASSKLPDIASQKMTKCEKSKLVGKEIASRALAAGTMANENIKKVKAADLELKERVVATNRVTKVTKGGRIFSFAVIVVVGNENGIVGYGLGKAREVSTAISKGVEDAKKNLIQVPILKGTIPHAGEGKYSGANVFMKPAAPGTGVIAGGAMRAVFESVGVKNVLAKSKGSSNPHSVVKATIGALAKMRDAYTVAQVRGVSLDKVFNG